MLEKNGQIRPLHHSQPMNFSAHPCKFNKKSNLKGILIKNFGLDRMIMVKTVLYLANESCTAHLKRKKVAGIIVLEP